STAHPAYIVDGPDGNVWFTEMESNKIGYINPNTRQITEFNLPQGDTDPTGMTKGSDNNLWFTGELSDKISKITPAGAVTVYSLPTSFVQPNSITAGPDGNLWFTIYGSNGIGVMNTSGTLLNEYNVTGGPEGISVGPDGNIWFCEQNAKQVVKMNINTGAVTNYPVTYAPEDTAPGPDGNVWFTMGNSSQIGKINPSTGAITYYNIPSSTSYIASFVTAGPDGNMWYSLAYLGLGTINPTTGATETYVTPSSSTGGAWGVVTGPDKNIWYTVNNNYSKIGVVNLGLSTPPSSVSTGSSGSSSSSSNSNSTGSSGSSSSSSNSNSTGSSGSSSSSSTSSSTGSSGSSSSSSTSSSTGSSGSSSSGSSSSQNNPSTTTAPTITSTSTTSNGMIVQTDSDGTTTATVPANLTINQIYEVPTKQVLYVDGYLSEAIASNGATIKGLGVINSLIVDKGASLSPGHSPGCITSNDLTMDGTYNVQLGGTTACKDYDQVIAKGPITLGGNLVVSLVNGFQPKPGQNFTIINNESKSTINGTFADLPEGTIFISNDVPYAITYKGGAGNDVVLNVLSKDTYLTALTSSNTNKKLVVSQKGIIPFIRRNATEIITVLAVTLIVVIGIILYLIKTHYKGIILPETTRSIRAKSHTTT
ncbi:MAG: SMP-30/gluconolactonase/LRE family protein, partial [Candidatus Saccharimonadales bacterium]